MEEHDDNDGTKRRLTAVAVASRAAIGSVNLLKSIVGLDLLDLSG